MVKYRLPWVNLVGSMANIPKGAFPSSDARQFPHLTKCTAGHCDHNFLALASSPNYVPPMRSSDVVGRWALQRHNAGGT